MTGVQDVCSSDLGLLLCSHWQASSDYDPSFVTEVLLKEIQYSETPNEDVNLLKDVAAQAYMG